MDSLPKLTPEQCQAFLDNPTINPITRRSIKEGGPVHKMLQKACLKDSLPKNYQSPLGPSIHPSIFIDDMALFKKNLGEWIIFIRNRLLELDSYTWIRKSELEDDHSMLMYIKKQMEKIGNPNAVQVIESIQGLLKQFKKDHKQQIHDDIYIQTPIRVRDDILTVSNDRYAVRNAISYIYGIVMENKQIMEYAVQTQKITLNPTHTLRESIETFQKYLNSVVEHHIFTKEEIYGKIFEPNVFTNLKSLIQKFRALYKKERGQSPEL